MNFSTLQQLNPWWQNKTAILQDKHITDYQNQKYQWQPGVLKQLAYHQGYVYSLRGARQVGKTTALKLEIKKLLLQENNIEPVRICYLACDLISDFKELHSVLEEYLNRAHLETQKPLFIFLDEISDVLNWQRALKFLKDLGRLPKSTLILTGSHSIDIQRSLEKLPGRRGESSKKLDLIMHPVSFKEYLSLNGFQPAGLTKINLAKLFTSGKIPKIVYDLNAHVSLLNKLLAEYLLSGGFISAINFLWTALEIPENVYDTYYNWLKGDFNKLQKQEAILKQVIKTNLETTGDPVSFQALARRTAGISYHSIAEYLELLELSFAVHFVYFYDLNQKQIKFKKNKKFYFQDPLIYHALLWGIQPIIPPFQQARQSLQDKRVLSKLLEGIVISHLKRLNEEVYYFQDRYNKEIDIIARGAFDFNIEVKFQNQIIKDDWKTLQKYACKKQISILLSKNDLRIIDKQIIILPLSVFLSMI